MPAFAVYFVKLPSIAAWAAAFTWSGVGKSGSPAPRSTTSIPWLRSRSAASSPLRVGDEAMRDIRDASMTDGSLKLRKRTGEDSPVRARPSPGRLARLLQPPLDSRRYERRHSAAEREHFLDEPRAEERVRLVRHEEHRLDARREMATACLRCT